MWKTIGFIGCGNIAKAMIGGMIQSKRIKENQIIVSNRSLPSLEEVNELYGVRATLNNIEVASEADILFLTIKSDQYTHVIEEIKDVVKENVIVIFTAVGETIEKNERRFNKPIKLIKAMPNTPVLVREGITGLAYNEYVSENELAEVKSIFESFGRVEVLDESLMDVVTAIGGSSPAYAYMFIEALADGGVLYGMPRNQAYIFAAQAILGAAKMVLETGIHPGALKDSVCSPGGVTIESVAKLEERGLRSAVIKAVKGNMEKAKEINERL